MKKIVTTKKLINTTPRKPEPSIQRPAFPEIIFEDENYLVINKPAGLTVHSGHGIEGVVLTDLLLARLPQIVNIGEDPIRPGIVHRLDKDVSGLMVIAKTESAFLSLKEQFQKRDINKEYLALVHGRLIKEEGEINFPIKRSREGHKMAALPLNIDSLLKRRLPKARDEGNILGMLKARKAITTFQVLKRFVNYTYISVKIKTGRTHQIRVHFFAYGHPLAGDNLYCTKKTKIRNKKLGLDRVFLVANRLSFKDLEGNRKEFILSLPADMETRLPKN